MLRYQLRDMELRRFLAKRLSKADGDVQADLAARSNDGKPAFPASLARGSTVPTHEIHGVAGGVATEEVIDADLFLRPDQQYADLLMDDGFLASLEESWPATLAKLQVDPEDDEAPINDMLSGRRARQLYKEHPEQPIP